MSGRESSPTPSERDLAITDDWDYCCEFCDDGDVYENDEQNTEVTSRNVCRRIREYRRHKEEVLIL